MAVGDSGYQGGGAERLTNFYNTLRQDEYRRQQLDAQQGQARAKAKDQTAKDLEGVMSKLSSKGLRNQAEIDIYAKMYEEAKGYKALANASETSTERAKNTVLFQDAARKAIEFVDGAEEYKRGELSIGSKFQADPFSFGEDQKTLYKSNLNIPYTQLGTRFDPTPYATRMKPEEADKMIDDRIKGLVEANGTLLTRTKGFNIGNNEGNLLYQDINLAPELAAKDVNKLLNDSIGLREYYQRLYPSLKTDELAVNIVKDKMEAGKLAKRDNVGSFVENNRPTSSGSGEDNDYIPATPTPKDFRSVDGKRVIQSDKFIAENMGKVVLPQIDQVYNITNGKNESLESLNDASVTGIGYFPANRTGKAGANDKPIKGVTITRIKSFGGIQRAEEIFLRESQIPAKFKQSKSYKKLEAKLDENVATAVVAKPTTTSAKPAKGSSFANK